MLVFIKLGGSLITDKNIAASYRREMVQRLGEEIRDALSQNPALRIIVGHGSGSFGHFVAKQHGTVQGVQTPQQWCGFAEVATTAAHLNDLVSMTLQQCGLPVMSFPPSVSARCDDGQLIDMELANLQLALTKGIIPLVHGDVAFDNVRGGTIISTEAVFAFLALQLPVQQILLLGDVDGVYDFTRTVIPIITPVSYPDIVAALGGSAGTDVTGGMLSKVQDALTLVQQVAGLEVRIMNGQHDDLLRKTLDRTEQPGTLIRAD